MAEEEEKENKVELENIAMFPVLEVGRAFNAVSFRTIVRRWWRGKYYEIPIHDTIEFGMEPNGNMLLQAMNQFVHTCYFNIMTHPINEEWLADENKPHYRLAIDQTPEGERLKKLAEEYSHVEPGGSKQKKSAPSIPSSPDS